MVKNFKRGDEVITSGGIIGKVDRVYEDDKLEIEISDGVKVNVIKNTVQSHLKKEVKKIIFCVKLFKLKVVSIYLIFILISHFRSLILSIFDNSFLKKKINLGLDLQGGSYYF